MSAVGYIGLGAMGGAMARNLLGHGRELVVFDVSEARLADLEDRGASRASSPSDVASRSEIVFTSLPGAPEVEEVYLGDAGVVAAARQGLLAVDMSTVPPATTRRVAERLRAVGAAMLDAPVARTKAAAEAGTLSIMVGGEQSDYERALPYLEQVGTSISHLGPVGSGNVAKLVNNAVLMSNIMAATEGLLVGMKEGVDPDKLAEVLSDGSADSFAMRNHVRGSVLTDDFGLERFPLTYALKDLDYFFEAAKRVQAECPTLDAMATLYRKGHEMGFSDEYFPVATKALEQMSDASFTRAKDSKHA